VVAIVLTYSSTKEMDNKMILFVLIMAALSVKSCEPYCVDKVYSIIVENKLIDTIQVYASLNYPDTSLSEEKPRLKMVYPNKYSRIDSNEKWEDILPNDTVCVFILSKDTVDKYSWDLIRSSNRILKRYDLSIKDLEKQNWTITYP